ncbi:hypothetical protein GCM10027321_46280 [Massilia terrae]|uniref:Uncharacterized protein n=1 Tax=Massilia terrae TaxID=1811224 RepID=A0ABT2D1V0_9BURK|nr:hypothetical protein [Massilia terrae]MCS0660079.1 hypothetical protein [Massilia terrae]
MNPEFAGIWPLVLAVLVVSALVLLALRRFWLVRPGRRIAVGESGLQLTFLDACAPEGGVVRFEDFPAGRLRSGTIHASDTRRA